MRRGTAATALVAALVLTASACGGGEEQSSGSGEISGTVTFWDTSGEAEKGTFEKLAKGFEKKYPDVKVDYVNIGFADAQNKFKNAAAAGEAPDVMRTEVAWVADFANLGYLEPLDDSPAVEGQDDYLPQAWSSTQFEGKTYAVPQVADTLALFYNKRLLEEADVQVPTTVAELETAAPKIKDRTGATPFYLRGDDPYWFYPYIYGEGGDLLDAEAKKVTVSDQPGVRAFQTMKDLTTSKVAITDLQEGAANQEKAFNNGEVAMTVNGPWALEATLAGKEFKDDPDNLGVAPVFGGSAGQGSPQGGWNYSVYAGSGNLDASKEFVRYMSSAASQQTVTEELNLLPTRASVYEVPAVEKNEMVQFFKPALDNAVARAWIPQAGSLFDPLKEQIARVLSNATSPESAAKAMGENYRELLKDEGWK